MGNLFVSEDWVSVEGEKRYRSGESGVYETFTDNIGELFLSCQKEYGKCVSKMFVDSSNGAKQIGWVFEKRRKYEDCNDTYLCETWVSLHDAPETRSVEYHYHFID